MEQIVQRSEPSGHHLWMDCARTLAVFLVIVIHVAAPIMYQWGNVNSLDWWVGNFYQSLSRSAVPIFLMLSGALLLGKPIAFMPFLKRRFQRVLMPLLIWSFIYVSWQAWQTNDTNFSLMQYGKDLFRGYMRGSMYHLWFVYVILGLYLFVPVINPWIMQARKGDFLFFGCCWLFTLIYQLPGWEHYLPKLYLNNFAGYLGYMILGYYIVHKLNSNFLRVGVFTFFIGVLATFLGTGLQSSINGNFYDVWYGYLTPNVAVSAIGAMLILKSLSFQYYHLTRIVRFFSKFSFGIYLIHVIILGIMDIIGMNWKMGQTFWAIPYLSLICLFLSIGLIWLLSLNKFTRILAG